MANRADRKTVKFSSHTTAERGALAFASRGYGIVILHGIANGRCTCKKKACTSEGKHPIASVHPHGFKDALRDAESIVAAFRANSKANYGVVPSGSLVAADVDSKKADALVLRSNLPDTFRVNTGRGYHLYFNLSDPQRWEPRKYDGIDFRFANNGYVVGPGSVHRSGTVYTAMGHLNDIASIAASDLRFRSNIIKVDFSKAEKDSIEEGRRNNELTRIAGALRGLGRSRDAIYQALRLSIKLTAPFHFPIAN